MSLVSSLVFLFAVNLKIIMQSIACSHNQCPHHGILPKLNENHHQSQQRQQQQDLLLSTKSPTPQPATVLKLSKESDQSSSPDKYHADDGSSTSNNEKKESEEVPSSRQQPSSSSSSSSSNNNNNKASSKAEIRSLLLKEAGFDIRSSERWQKKRQNYLNWDDFFFGVAVLSSRRSKNPIAPNYGACIVDDENRVVGIGYDGLPRDCPDDCIPYQQQQQESSSSNGNDSNDQTIPFLHTQNPFIVRAEINAILNKCSADVAGCRLYCMCYPCNECAKVIIQSRIREVIYLKDEEPDKDIYKASRILFTMAGVKTTHYSPLVSSIDLEFVSALAPTTRDAVCEAEEEKEIPNSNTDRSPEDISSSSSSSTTTNNKERFRDLMIREAGYDPVTSPSLYRTDHISWDDYFMAMAFLTAQRSKDPNTQVGAVIVQAKTKRILALGYNGFPRGCSDDCLPWARKGTSELQKKYVYVCHAEVNAVLNKGSSNVRGATIYVALFPCNECCKVIIQAGIQEVVYMSDQYHDTDSCRASRIMFQMAGVRLRKHIPTFQSLHLSLKEEEEEESNNDDDDDDDEDAEEEENVPPN